MSQKFDDITNFILRHVREYPSEVTRMAVDHFGISRQAVNRYMKYLVKEGVLSESGNTRSRKYTINPILNEYWDLNVKENQEEDRVWRNLLKPYTTNLPKNIQEICQYGFTEIYNNVIDHSESQTAVISLTIYPDWIRITVKDNGVGIFNKIQSHFNLDDPMHAILELSKGKLSTDPGRHSGEGIFFTSRMFDTFSIVSSHLIFCHSKEGGMDALFEEKEFSAGTTVVMETSLFSSATTEEIFNEYSINGGFGFDRTVIPVFLGGYGDENLVSRSQARRLLARINRFKLIVFDFNKVEMIGQAFADEIFRVYANENPAIKLMYVNVNKKVEGMIKRVIDARIGD
ncbi:hypothetical protein ADN00_10870 [Ornatilinea apprima]|uniref:DUF4325 domain-containing protein n=1 Tax=Ornatilinea apprima TaxID=1134406 RepID=A0A0P6XA18_9CHLR|nr:DUF4325 domain-containing protein [Ornatilinea apprima]KPL77051.1 hypothetical protein ADN00_10870 [Ornatilinea apprima]